MVQPVNRPQNFKARNIHRIFRTHIFRVSDAPSPARTQGGWSVIYSTYSGYSSSTPSYPTIISILLFSLVQEWAYYGIYHVLVLGTKLYVQVGFFATGTLDDGAILILGVGITT